MKGTEKQIKWAEDIINGARHAVKRAEAVARTDAEKEYIARNIATLEAGIAKAEANGWTAKDWIDRRNRFDGQTLLQKILRDGYGWGVDWQVELWKRENGKENF